MQPPMIGTWQVRIMAARAYSIHGDAYYEMQVTPDNSTEAEPSQMILRAPSHAFTTPPATNQRVEIQFLMGQVTSVKVI